MTLLEKLSNISVIAVAAVILGAKAYTYLVPSQQPAFRPPSQLVGKSLPIPNPGTKGSVALFVSKDCHYCTDSMGFYHRLSDLTASTKCDLGLMAIGPQDREKREDIQSYLTAHDLKVDRIEMRRFIDLGVMGTPTLVFRDRQGIVRSAWLGRLNESSENELIEQVKSVCQV